MYMETKPKGSIHKYIKNKRKISGPIMFGKAYLPYSCASAPGPAHADADRAP